MTDVEIIASIFDPANKKVCSDCPCADPNSTVDSCYGHVSKEAGCCSRCARSFGYLEDYTPQLKYRWKKRYGWDKKYGFFNNETKECGLPREKRSATCLRYSCDALRAAIPYLQQEKVRRAINRLLASRC